MSKPEYVPKPVPPDKRDAFDFVNPVTGSLTLVKRVPLRSITVWASACGTVIVKWNAQRGVFKQCKLKESDNGALCAYAFDGVKARPYAVHRLVALAWLGAPRFPMLVPVFHRDGNKRNNHCDNLTWGALHRSNELS